MVNLRPQILYLKRNVTISEIYYSKYFHFTFENSEYKVMAFRQVFCLPLIFIFMDISPGFFQRLNTHEMKLHNTNIFKFEKSDF
jgi:hypothetical protein